MPKGDLPDIILLDLEMPVMNGFEFIKQLMTLDLPPAGNTRIIVVSSSALPKDLEQAKSIGITHYLTKPIVESQLKTMIYS